jgi:hypothetical protein
MEQSERTVVTAAPALGGAARGEVIGDGVAECIGE